MKHLAPNKKFHERLVNNWCAGTGPKPGPGRERGRERERQNRTYFKVEPRGETSFCPEECEAIVQMLGEPVVDHLL